MARREALLRLHKSLLTRRDELRRKLADDLRSLRNTQADSTGDAADVAFESGSDEMASQLAELDSRELGQIDRALARLKQGTYGVCESCQGKIPVGRLNALPFCTLCIECQREMEKYPGWIDQGSIVSWDRVFDTAPPLEEQREVDLSQIEIDLPNNR
jgi:DnaK suppressor protein